IWIVDNSNIISILINKSPVELDNLIIIKYLKLLNKQIFPFNCILQEIRYKPSNDEEDDEKEIPQRKLTILQTIFFNGTKIIDFIEIEKIIKNLEINNEFIGIERKKTTNN
ncbi:CA domain-containing protein, partial [Meloidogyne graminicola]